jgi:hypothetical protein
VITVVPIKVGAIGFLIRRGRLNGMVMTSASRLAQIFETGSGFAILLSPCSSITRP